MLAMRLHAPGTPLVPEQQQDPLPGKGEVLLRVTACGVCRTDLHIVDGELALPKLPVVPGHEIVGVVEALGDGARGVSIGERVGVPWLGQACGHCPYCDQDRENLCDTPSFTGLHRDGGYATQVVADARFCHSLEGIALSDAQAAPLLCAGLIGWRSLKFAGDAQALGLYGFGAAAHLIAQVAIRQGRRVYAFVRPGDSAAAAHARTLGVQWAGGSDETPPEALDAAILFAPVGALVPQALRALRKGGTVVCGGIHMSDIPSFPYEILWNEREIRSVANLTRDDGREFLDWVRANPIRVDVQTWPLDQANEALAALREGRVTGAAVLLP
ncbi:MAG: zinc-dependent alcohol dehydrogenase family protein [Burkholderiaceae bacterium]|nr:zinc-dependent alcohol dehydrogenase family protein [Burkholderiaceae bacterium]